MDESASSGELTQAPREFGMQIDPDLDLDDTLRALEVV